MGGFILVLDSEISSLVEVSEICVDYLDNYGGVWIGTGKKTYIPALKKINFSINRGEVMALVGRNGSGKSTLLKTIAGQIRPTSGSIKTNGRVILLAGVNPGFNPDISGRSNLYDLSLAYGVEENEVEDFVESVMEFADLGSAIDRRLRGYSSGMEGKLGFGFITGLKPDVLLIDETMAVGDEEFRIKAQKRIRDFVRKSGCAIISTHSLGMAREMCNRGIVLNKGILVEDGEIEEAMLAYRKIIKSE